MISFSVVYIVSVKAVKLSMSSPGVWSKIPTEVNKSFLLEEDKDVSVESRSFGGNGWHVVKDLVSGTYTIS